MFRKPTVQRPPHVHHTKLAQARRIMNLAFNLGACYCTCMQYHHGFVCSPITSWRVVCLYDVNKRKRVVIASWPGRPSFLFLLFLIVHSRYLLLYVLEPRGNKSGLATRAGGQGPIWGLFLRSVRRPRITRTNLDGYFECCEKEQEKREREHKNMFLTS